MLYIIRRQEDQTGLNYFHNINMDKKGIEIMKQVIKNAEDHLNNGEYDSVSVSIKDIK